MKKYKVTVLVSKPVYVEYLVDAKNELDAIQNYDGFPVINEEPYQGDSEEVVEVIQLTPEEVKSIEEEMKENKTE